MKCAHLESNKNLMIEDYRRGSEAVLDGFYGPNQPGPVMPSTVKDKHLFKVYNVSGYKAAFGRPVR
jgi:hypothetical protein